MLKKVMGVNSMESIRGAVVLASTVITFCPGKSTGRELSPKVKEIEPSGFQQNVRFEILQLAPQEQNLGQPRF